MLFTKNQRGLLVLTTSLALFFNFSACQKENPITPSTTATTTPFSSTIYTGNFYGEVTANYGNQAGYTKREYDLVYTIRLIGDSLHVGEHYFPIDSAHQTNFTCTNDFATLEFYNNFDSVKYSYGYSNYYGGYSYRYHTFRGTTSVLPETTEQRQDSLLAGDYLLTIKSKEQYTSSMYGTNIDTQYVSLENLTTQHIYSTNNSDYHDYYHSYLNMISEDYPYDSVIEVAITWSPTYFSKTFVGSNIYSTKNYSYQGPRQ